MNDRPIHCAIYTRKSSEEGLEQSFNSLEAQREACCAFVQSQKHEGWRVLSTAYDDGGFSGGTMDRPALNRLLGDIVSGEVDTVVVYKVDRLTRSLTDFAKIIEIFDSHKVTFVSVTQQFNTTTSMGRLTLNVLLSFAQFEREITGERIRDKFAASKKKGMWMGGLVPLGYDRVDRRLVINPGEAKIVRTMFTIYLRLGCVRKLKNLLDQRQIRSKVRTSAAGETIGGRPLSRGALFHLLNNRIYLGEIVHKGASFPGQHDAIVSQRLWDQVAAQLSNNDNAHRTGQSHSTPSLLAGKLFDTKGIRFTPTHAVKNGKRYRYYTSQAAVQHAINTPSITRFPAHQLEQVVLAQMQQFLQAPEKWQKGVGNGPEVSVAAERARNLGKIWLTLPAEEQRKLVQEIVRRVIIGEGALWIEVERTKLLAHLLQEPDYRAPSGKSIDPLKLAVKFDSLHRGNELRVVIPNQVDNVGTAPIPSLVNVVARAKNWYERIVAGEIRSIDQLAKEAGLGHRHTRRILRCAILSPNIVEALLSGRHRPDLTVNQILKKVPLDWRQQKTQILRVE